MKFAHDFIEALKKEEYPQQWVQSALSYRQLKKCIKKVQKELGALGLDPCTLNLLWQSIKPAVDADSTKGQNVPHTRFQYSFTGLWPFSLFLAISLKSLGDTTFRPKLTFVIDPEDGSPVDACLSPDTHEYLQGLARSQRLGKIEVSPDFKTGQCTQEEVKLDHSDSDSFAYLNSQAKVKEADAEGNHFGFEIVEIPLASDSEFFQILKRELSSLEELQEQEQKRLSQQVIRLGQDLAKVAKSSSDKSKSEVYAWREVFRLYVESQIFFSTGERETGARGVLVAENRLKTFNDTVLKDKRSIKFNKTGRAALERFMRINFNLLQNLKFQDINRLALTKIMKKFDKHTALRAQTTFPQHIAYEPYLAQTMAKAVSFQISEEILNIIPQLSDYLCPICFSISFKPIRLRCGHVFCIRCLITMQRARQDHCPMCRGNVVMEASSGMQYPLHFDEACFSPKCSTSRRKAHGFSQREVSEGSKS